MISEGQVVPSRFGPDHHLGATVPVNLVDLVRTSTADLLDDNPNTYILKQHYASPQRYTKFWHEKFSNTKVESPVTDNQVLGTFAYTPIGYLHMALFAKIGSLLNLAVLPTWYLARLANLLMYIALVYMALRVMPKFRWLLVFVALLPAALFQASVVTLDALVNGLAFLLFAYAVRFWYLDKGKKITARDGVITGLLLGLLALTKEPYAVFLLVFLFLPKRAFRTSQDSYVWKAAWTFVTVSLLMAWTVINKNVTPDIVLLQQGGTTSMSGQLSKIIHNPAIFVIALFRTFYDGIDVMLGGMIGKIGDRFVGISDAFLYFFFICTSLLAAIFYRHNDSPGFSRDQSRIFNWVLSAVCVLGIIGICLALYLSFSPVGAKRISGVQGRYFIPLLPFALLLVSRTAPFKLTAEGTKSAPKIFMSMSVLFLTVTSVLYFVVNY